jgi:hypothetical protein
MEVRSEKVLYSICRLFAAHQGDHCRVVATRVATTVDLHHSQSHVKR